MKKFTPGLWTSIVVDITFTVLEDRGHECALSGNYRYVLVLHSAVGIVDEWLIDVSQHRRIKS